MTNEPLTGLKKWVREALASRLRPSGRASPPPASEASGPRVFDCFMFSNELDVLEVRLGELDEVVDHFVLIESPLTHQGHPKPLHYRENAGRFERFARKIRHVVVDDMPKGDDHWQRESYQRSVLRSAIADAAPGDVVLVSDVDEIPRASAVRLATRTGDFTFFELSLNYYYFNLAAGQWLKSYSAPKHVIDRMADLSLPRWQEAAFLEQIGRPADQAIIRDAGWHLTWQGGVSAIIAKLDAFAHAEFQHLRDPELIARAMAERRFFIGNEALHEIPTDSLPTSVKRNIAYYRQKGYLSPAAG